MHSGMVTGTPGTEALVTTLIDHYSQLFQVSASLP